MKSFRPKDGSGNAPENGRNGEQDFRGEKRSNDTRESTTDPDARLYRKSIGQESRLSYMAHAIMENRNGLAVCGEVTRASGTAEQEAALAWVARHRSRRRITLGADKAYDVINFVKALKKRNVTPHIAINGNVRWNGTPRKTAVDRRTTRHVGYRISQCIRKRIEEIFGWIKPVGDLDQLKVRGLKKANAAFVFALVAYHLVRLAKLVEIPP
jgi:hypothetical protein